jgi:hypothetical protein
MDQRTTLRELDELIARARTTTERETALLDVLPECWLRDRKIRQIRTMKARLHQLRVLRTALKLTRLPRGSHLH